MKNQKGFSLIELLIVVVIIGIIAAIAIPNLLAARRSANEGLAISALRTLHGAQMAYASTYGNGNYAGVVSSLVPDNTALSALGTPGLLDSVLSTGTKAGYNFVGGRIASSTTTPAQFYFSANPTVTTGVAKTGARRFGFGTEGVIYADPTAANLGTAYVIGDFVTATPLNN